MTFNERCYELLKKIPEGKVTTYKAIADALETKAYRAVGNAMAKNPNVIAVPCHRVVNTNGKLGGYALGLEKKIALLKQEGVIIENGKIKDLTKVLFDFK